MIRAEPYWFGGRILNLGKLRYSLRASHSQEMLCKLSSDFSSTGKDRLSTGRRKAKQIRRKASVIHAMIAGRGEKASSTFRRSREGRLSKPSFNGKKTSIGRLREDTDRTADSEERTVLSTPERGLSQRRLSLCLQGGINIGSARTSRASEGTVL